MCPVPPHNCVRQIKLNVHLFLSSESKGSFIQLTASESVALLVYDVEEREAVIDR